MNRHSTSVVAPTGALKTPYASRGFLATRSTDYPGSLRRRTVSKSPYSPLTDPHLKRYFTDKLLNPPSLLRLQVSSPAPNHSSVQSVSSYKVTVRTGHTGTSAKVYVTLTGNKGRLLRKRLRKGGHTTLEPGSTEVFRVRGTDIGTLKSVTVENEGLKVTDGWYVESVGVVCPDGGKWCCLFNQWLSLHHTDCQLVRQVKPRPLVTRPPIDVTYDLVINTGDVRGAGSTANIFITIHGTKNSSPKTQLLGCFDRAATATSSLQAQDLGRVTDITVEHDNSGFGPDWFLDYISLQYKERTVFFPCAQWLSRQEGDGAIARCLTSSTHSPLPYVDKSYIVTVVTGHVRGAGTQANVFLTLKGTGGSSEERLLDNDKDNFTRGRTDTFLLHCSDLGPLTCLIVRHDNAGPHPGWLLDRVCVTCEGVEVCFQCGRWLELCEGCGGETKVTLQPGVMLTEEVKESHQYLVTVETGSRPGATTTANVYVILHGCHGDSGRLWLSGSGRSFASGGVDQFNVTCACVGSVESVGVGHDNSGPSPGWFLAQVEVCCSEGRWVCPCDRWLCLDSGDGRIERELHPCHASQDEEGVVSTLWTVHVWTSDMRGAGTDANVTIQVHGSHGDSPVIPLGDGVANFEQGEHDVFRDIVLCDGVGVVESISVSHDGARPFPDWHLERVSLVNQHTGEHYQCHCDRWLVAKEDGTVAKVKLKAVLQATADSVQPEIVPDTTPTYIKATPYETTPPYIDATPTRSLTSQYVSQLRNEVSPSVHSPPRTLPYTVLVMSGAPPLSDPAPCLVITLVGMETASAPIRLQRLDSSGYVPGRPDTFSIQCLSDIGPIRQLKVLLEGCTNCPPWLIEQISVTSPTLGNTHSFPCGRGLTVGSEVTLNELTNTGNSSVSMATNANTHTLTGYEVKVYTSDKKGAGTQNDLHLVLRGVDGASHPHTIKNSHSMFQRGQIDTFQIATDPIGRLTSLDVAHGPHGNRGDMSSWYLFQVVVTEMASGVMTMFPCRQWLPASEQATHHYTTLHTKTKQ